MRKKKHEDLRVIVTVFFKLENFKEDDRPGVKDISYPRDSAKFPKRPGRPVENRWPWKVGKVDLT